MFSYGRLARRHFADADPDRAADAQHPVSPWRVPSLLAFLKEAAAILACDLANKAPGASLLVRNAQEAPSWPVIQQCMGEIWANL